MDARVQLIMSERVSTCIHTAVMWVKERRVDS